MARKPTRAAPAEPPVDETIVAQPDWPALLPNADEQAVARGHWRRIVQEMMSREILSSSNGHALQRLVLAYIVYDRCSREVAATGLVTEANKENSKAIDRLSIYYKAMREAETTAERLEAQLGLSPGRRSKVGKVAKQRRGTAGADQFLGPKG
ncbi:phage terminase small subunit P27 family [Sphingomonas sp. 2378]|uniref:phage terminase small subunit P27 family n=1 Tax=Sphingomonas sp. 2378 TaxID=1219748 RepID=UPI00311B2FC3